MRCETRIDVGGVLQQDFQKRLAGISLLLPLAVAVFWGGFIAIAAISLISILLAFEFTRLLEQNPIRQLAVGAYLMMPPLMFAAGIMTNIAIVILALGLVVLIFRFGMISGIYAAGLSLFFCAFVFLVHVPDFFIQLLAVGVVITAVDIGAYLVGRRVGGPKLAPKISPQKTISGAIGGLIFGTIAGVMVASFLEIPIFMAVLLAIVIAVIAQAGDLFESALKRRCNVKDSSGLIPGHGGFLDRFDGYIFVMPLLVMLNSLTGVSV